MGGSKRAASCNKPYGEDMTGVFFITIGVALRTAPLASPMAIVAVLVGDLVMAKRASCGTSHMVEDGCTPHHPGHGGESADIPPCGILTLVIILQMEHKDVVGL